MKVLSGVLNALTLAGLVGFGAYNIKDVNAQEHVNSLPDNEVHCLQQNIFFEARNQSTLGQVAVAWVTLNRVDSNRYPSSICEVVWQHKQFSWTNTDKVGEPSDNILEQRAWEDAGLIAKVVLMDWIKGKSSPVEQSVMYHADYVKPYWAASYEQVVKIDNHIFYR